MPLIKKNEFAELANYNDTNCISIYLPTHRSGMEVNEDKDLINFKNHLQTITSQLEDSGLSGRDIDRILTPARDLLTESYFWRHMSDGLAVFIADGFFQYHTLPVSFENFNHIAGHFYLSPLMPLYNGDGRFFLLELSQDGTRFFEGTRHSITEVGISELVPEELRDVVGYDYEEKSLQWRSGSTGMSGSGSMFHGQGRNTSDDKNEIKRYCRAINDGLMTMLNVEYAPLVIACDDYIFAIYQEVNDYKYLHPENISGNMEHKHPTELQERAWKIVHDHFQQERKESLDEFSGFLAYQKASNDLEEIVPAALNGRVHTLFLQKQTDAFGIFDAATQKVRVDEERTPANVSLPNMAAIQTFLQDGKVYMMEPEEMPLEGTLASAIFRY